MPWSFPAVDHTWSRTARAAARFYDREMAIDESKLRWQDLSPKQQAVVLGAAVIELILLVAALVDLKRRPAEQVRGRKGVWALASFAGFVGPISYFAFGRKR